MYPAIKVNCYIRDFGDCVKECKGTEIGLEARCCRAYAEKPSLNVCVEDIGNFEGTPVGICQLFYKEEDELKKSVLKSREVLKSIQRI